MFIVIGFKLLKTKKMSLLFHRKTSLVKKMEKTKIIPDVIDKGPPLILKVCYGGGLKIVPGDEVTPTQTRHEPCLFWETDNDTFYTLLLTDPDAPSRKEPKFREWQHWLVGNIPADSIAKGDVLSEYVGPGPPLGTGMHRYVFLIYRQKDRIMFDEIRLTNHSSERRMLFSTRKFIAKYKLEGPVVGNYFFAKYDAYVDRLYKQLSGKRL